MTTTQIGELTIDDIVRPGFAVDAARRGAGCNGVHHNDFGRVGTCTGCGAEVVNAERGGLFPLLRYTTEAGRERAVYACYRPTHACDTEQAAAHRARTLRELARGVPVLRAPVRVEHGANHKVPWGTEGTVVWAGEGDFGPRVGLRDAEGVTHWTAAGNVRVLPGPALLAEIEAQVAADVAAAKAEAEEAAAKAHRELQQAVLRRWLRAGNSLVGRRVALRALSSGKPVGEGEIVGQYDARDGSGEIGFEIRRPDREGSDWRSVDQHGVAWDLLD